MKLLHIDSSILNDNSVSRQLTRDIVDRWRQDYPDGEVTYRDLAEEAPNHLSAEILGAGSVDQSQRSAVQCHEVAYGEALMKEFLEADVIVLGAPMYNFSIPSQLKAWLDRVMVAGRTFKYTENGPVGLISGKKVVIVSSRGGVYSESSTGQAMDHQESYLQVALAFMGITDISIVRAEGMSMAEKRNRAIVFAQKEIHRLLKAA